MTSTQTILAITLFTFASAAMFGNQRNRALALLGLAIVGCTTPSGQVYVWRTMEVPVSIIFLPCLQLSSGLVQLLLLIITLALIRNFLDEMYKKRHTP